MKIISVFGTRPEAIKMAPIVRNLAERSGSVTSKVIVTGQHREMLDQVLELFGIVPDYDLDVMKDNQTPIQVAASIMSQLEPIFQQEKPDWVLVQGDTTTVATVSLTAFYSRIKVGHVEAGLRTFDKWQPFPEEINRRVASVTADLHFAPTHQAKQNLLNEGVAAKDIVVTGNPVIDALKWVAQQPLKNSLLDQLNDNRKLILVTAHRRENFGKPLENICLALRELAEKYDGQLQIVYPVHRNPNVQNTVYPLLEAVPNIKLLPPLDYLSLVHLMKQSTIVLTDSGGIQEEAPSLGKPVLVLRETTERPEAVEAGTVKIVGTDRRYIVTEVLQLLENSDAYEQMAQSVNPYGDGHAAERIVGALMGDAVEPFLPKQFSSEQCFKKCSIVGLK